MPEMYEALFEVTESHGNRSPLNPLMPETFMPSNFKIQPKISSHRLPTHRHGAHRNFFLYPFFFRKRNFDYTVTIVAVRQ